MYSSTTKEETEAKLMRRIFILFPKETGGELYIFCYKDDDTIRLPGIELTNGDDPEDAVKAECPKKYGLTPTELKKVYEPPFKLWDVDFGGPVAYMFYEAKKFTGDFPPDAEFVHSSEVYGIIDELRIDIKKPKKRRISLKKKTDLTNLTE